MQQQELCPFIPLTNNIYCKRVKKMGKKQVGIFQMSTPSQEDNVSVGKVLAVGDKVEWIKVGDIITIPLMNTLRHYFDQTEYLITQENLIVGKLNPEIEVTTEF